MEFKVPGKKQSKEQKVQEVEIHRRKGLYIVLYSINDAINFYNNLMKI